MVCNIDFKSYLTRNGFQMDGEKLHAMGGRNFGGEIVGIFTQGDRLLIVAERRLKEDRPPIPMGFLRDGVMWRDDSDFEFTELSEPDWVPTENVLYDAAAGWGVEYYSQALRAVVGSDYYQEQGALDGIARPKELAPYQPKPFESGKDVILPESEEHS